MDNYRYKDLDNDIAFYIDEDNYILYSELLFFIHKENASRKLTEKGKKEALEIIKTMKDIPSIILDARKKGLKARLVKGYTFELVED